MLKKIGVIGYGVVGKSCFHPFRYNSEVIVVDPKYSKKSVKDLIGLNPPLIFVAINAPTLDDKSIDATVIYAIFQELTELKYEGVVVLRSTLTPDIVDDLSSKYSEHLHYIYSPEFLREAHWEKDADTPPMIIMAGTAEDCESLRKWYKNHSCIPQWTRFHITDFKTASLAKYAINSYLAGKVIFMNQMNSLFVDMNPDSTADNWAKFTEILSSDIRFGSSHLNVPGPDGEYGYGGTCFPKDVNAIIGYDKNNRLSVIREVAEANTQIRITGKGS